MALSNIFNEPRREITESALGVGLFAAAVFGDYHLAHWFHKHDPTTDVFLGMVLLPILICCLLIMGALVLAGGSILIHALGEGACNLLEDFGIQLRPTQRYRGEK